MRRTVLVLSAFVMVALFGQSGADVPSTPESEPAEAEVAIGRVRLLEYKVEYGEVDSALIKTGMQRVLQELEVILQEELKAGRDVHGLMEGSFRLEPNGVIRMYLEGESSLLNEGGTTIADKLTGVVFGAKVMFPSLGQPCFVSWKIEILKGQ